MLDSKIIWFNSKAAKAYNELFSQKSSGIIDETYVKNYIKNEKHVKVVCLGIGTGRELSWLEKIENIKEIIGVDYSDAMLNYCMKNVARCKKKD